MADPTIMVGLASSGLVAFALASAAALKGWNGWLELRRLEIEGRQQPEEPRLPPTAARIELADLKERVRRLEAIASGVDL